MNRRTRIVFRANAMLRILLTTICLGTMGCIDNSRPEQLRSSVAMPDLDRSLGGARLGGGVTVILFQGPAGCLTCSGGTYHWIELTRQVEGDLLMVLTETPTVEEAAVLRRMRLNFTVVDELGRKGLRLTPPAIRVFDGADTLIFEGNLTARRRVRLLDSSRLLLRKKLH